MVIEHHCAALYPAVSEERIFTDAEHPHGAQLVSCQIVHQCQGIEHTEVIVWEIWTVPHEESRQLDGSRQGVLVTRDTDPRFALIKVHSQRRQGPHGKQESGCEKSVGNA